MNRKTSEWFDSELISKDNSEGVLLVMLNQMLTRFKNCEPERVNDYYLIIIDLLDRITNLNKKQKKVSYREGSK